MSDPVTMAVQARIARQISTPEGRQQLAESMTQPVRCGGLDYVGPHNIPIYSHEKRMLAAIEPQATRDLVYRLLGMVA